MNASGFSVLTATSTLFCHTSPKVPALSFLSS